MTEDSTEKGRTEEELLPPRELSLAHSMGMAPEQIVTDVERFGRNKYIKSLKKAARSCAALDTTSSKRGRINAILLDLAFTQAINTQGYTEQVEWYDAKNNKWRRLNLLMIYNGTLSSPKIERSHNGEVVIARTIGSGVILGPKSSAPFGIEAPVTDTFSEWRPCLFEGDPECRRKTPIVSVANDINVDVRVIKAACNAAIHRASERNRRGWVLHPISPGSIVQDIMTVPDIEAKKRLAFHYLAFEHPEEYAQICTEYAEFEYKPPEPEAINELENNSGDCAE